MSNKLTKKNRVKKEVNSIAPIAELVNASYSKNKEKPTILVCSDGPHISTGFGRVTGNLIQRWLKTGKYRIVVMATNDNGDYHEIRGANPDLIIEPLPYIGEDPYGLHRMPKILAKYKPDLIFSLNDVWVWTADDRHPGMLNWFLKHIKNYRPYVPWIGYFPVDGRPWEKRWVDLVNSMTYAGVFCDYAHKVLSETEGCDIDKVSVIYHGHDTQNFFPLPQKDKEEMRKLMEVPNDAFLVGCINRNQPRKNIPALIQAFKMFNSGYVKCKTCSHPRNLEVMKDCEICGDTEYTPGRDGVENSYLYLHMNMMDGRGYRLGKIQADNKCKNIIARMDHDVAVGVPIETLNAIYNACDVTVNPTTAGGYELTVAESMAAGTPVIATRTTSITEQLENDRGYLVRPSAYIVLDDANHCLKHIIDLQGLVDALFRAYDNPEERKLFAENGIPFSKSRNWDKSAKQFEKLIDKALDTRIMVHSYCKEDKENVMLIHDSNNFGQVISMIPSLNIIARRDTNVNFILAVKKEMIPLLSHIDKSVSIIDLDRIWVDDKKISKFKFQANNISQIPLILERNALNADGAYVYSYIESYARAWNIKINFGDNFKLIDDIYSITDEENKYASDILYSALDNKKFKIAFIDSNSHFSNNYHVNSSIFSKAIKLLSSTEDVFAISLSQNTKTENIANFDIDLSGLSYRQLIAIASKVDCIVTSDEEYIHLANILNIPIIAIEGPKKFDHIIKHAKSELKSSDGSIKKLVYSVNNKPQFGCMPCFKNSDQRCAASGTLRAACIDSISYPNIFVAITKILEIWKENKQ